MVEKRIERVREKEKSVLYKAARAGSSTGAAFGEIGHRGGPSEAYGTSATGKTKLSASPSPPLPKPDAVALSEAESAQIETQLTPEQLQLFAEENDSMLRIYEDTLSKVQYVFLSLSSWPLVI